MSVGKPRLIINLFISIIYIYIIMLIKIIFAIILIIGEVSSKKLDGYLINYEKTGNIRKDVGKEIITTTQLMNLFKHNF